MRIFQALMKAVSAFEHALRTQACKHPALTLQREGGQASCSSYCPDCGYKVQLLWTLYRCRTCGSRRPLKHGANGQILTVHPFCRHCGQTDYRIVKKTKLTIHEYPYAVLTPEVDYTEETFPGKAAGFRDRDNPFSAVATPPSAHIPHIVNGTVLHQREWRI